MATSAVGATGPASPDRTSPARSVASPSLPVSWNTTAWDACAVPATAPARPAACAATRRAAGTVSRSGCTSAYQARVGSRLFTAATAATVPGSVSTSESVMAAASPAPTFGTMNPDQEHQYPGRSPPYPPAPIRSRYVPATGYRRLAIRTVCPGRTPRSAARRSDSHSPRLPRRPASSVTWSSAPGRLNRAIDRSAPRGPVAGIRCW